MNALVTGEREDTLLLQANILGSYAIATSIALVLALIRKGPWWTGSAFVAVDAALVVALFHEHLFGPVGNLNHSLTAPGLAVAFLLLNHVALRLQPRLVVLFTSLVLAGWFALLGVWELRTLRVSSLGADVLSTFFGESAVALAFAAFIAFMLTSDHNTLRRSAQRIEHRRQNLSRFFSPKIVTELGTKADSTRLERRDAAVMFVDLHSFTRFRESRPPEEVGEMLVDYRELVAGVVFDHGGTEDKFIGDGVMALFGQPTPSRDDADRALLRAQKLRDALGARWEQRRRYGKPALDAGIGLHLGPVIGGVLRNGQHDEFTVFGDTVNVAGRLERVAEGHGASLVASDDLLVRVQEAVMRPPWNW